MKKRIKNVGRARPSFCAVKARYGLRLDMMYMMMPMMTIAAPITIHMTGSMRMTSLPLSR